MIGDKDESTGEYSNYFPSKCAPERSDVVVAEVRQNFFATTTSFFCKIDRVNLNFEGLMLS